MMRAAGFDGSYRGQLPTAAVHELQGSQRESSQDVFDVCGR